MRGGVQARLDSAQGTDGQCQQEAIHDVSRTALCSMAGIIIIGRQRADVEQ
jgi:hypothetical protein